MKEPTMTAVPPILPQETSVDREVKEALRQVLALRALTSSTGTVTTYTQNKVLRALSPEALTRVAVILNELDKGGAR
jgi:non-canonical (house-cleaning) NTP pyrophosphatase